MAFEIAEPGWVAISRNDVTGRVSLKRVGFFEVDDEGITPLVKDNDGVFFPPGPETVEVIKTDALHTAKLAWMHKLMGMAERATTSAEFEAVERLADFVMNWEPGNGR